MVRGVGRNQSVPLHVTLMPCGGVCRMGEKSHHTFETIVKCDRRRPRAAGVCESRITDRGLSRAPHVRFELAPSPRLTRYGAARRATGCHAATAARSRNGSPSRCRTRSSEIVASRPSGLRPAHRTPSASSRSGRRRARTPPTPARRAGRHLGDVRRAPVGQRGRVDVQLPPLPQVAHGDGVGAVANERADGHARGLPGEGAATPPPTRRASRRAPRPRPRSAGRRRC